MPEWAAEQYRRVKIAFITGWQLDYIDGLGLMDQEAVLQIYEAEQAIMKPRGKNGA